MKFLLSFVFAFACTAYVIPILRKLAFKFNILDIPNGSIKVHKEPTPYLGGVGIYFGFIVALGLTLPFENKIFLFLIGSTTMLLTGLADDLVVMTPIQKILGQIISAFCFVKAGFYLKHGFFCNNFWSIPISLFWILGISNAFNLIDIMDGLATTVACCATINYIIIAALTGDMLILTILFAFLGALLGFFIYNKPNAKIYMGDAGALFIGGFLAIIPFLFDWSQSNYYGFLTPIIVLAIPLIEVGTLIIIRTYKKIPFYLGSPDHFAIYLQKGRGWSKNKVLLYTSLVSIVLAVFSILFFTAKIGLIGLILFTFLFLSFWYFMLFYKKLAK